MKEKPHLTFVLICVGGGKYTDESDVYVCRYEIRASH